MTVTIPATVTNLQEAFRGCTNLTAVTLEHTHNALIDGTVTMTNAFYGCTNLATVYCHNAPAISETTWHAFRIKSNGDVNVFNGTEWRPSETPVSLSGEIEATKKTNLVSFGDFTDTQIADMMTNGKSFTSDDHALDPTAKNFVLWGADGTNFETNLPLGGGGSVTYPEGYVYQQLYFPAVTIGGKSYPAGWGKTPIELGMTPASGCKWEEFTGAFSTYSYLKIGSETTPLKLGHNAYHRHSHDHAHIHSHTAYTGCYSTNNEAGGYGLGGQPGFQNRVMVSAPSNVGTSTDYTGPSSWSGSQWVSNIYTSYNGNSTEQTVEVNHSNMKIWKVVADT